MVLATGLAFFGYNYILFFFLTWFPSYLTMAQHLSIKDMSIATVLPWVLGFVGLALGGWVSDVVFRRTGRALFARKLVLTVCLSVAAVCVALAGLVDHGRRAAVLLMACAVFFLYLTGSTYWAIVQDTVRGAHVGGVGGFVHVIANCAGIIGPTVTGFIVQYTGAFTSAFVLAGALAIVGVLAVVFFVRPIPHEVAGADGPRGPAGMSAGADREVARVACIGECMVELRELPDGLLSRGYGGDTLNTAVYLARLGVAVDYVTALGDDPLSEEMLAGWRAEGVGTGLVARLPGRLPGLYLIQTDAARRAALPLLARPGAGARAVRACRRRTRWPRRWPATTGSTSPASASRSTARPGGSGCSPPSTRPARRGGRVAFDTNFRPRGWPDPAVARAAYRRGLRAGRPRCSPRPRIWSCCSARPPRRRSWTTRAAPSWC